MQFARFSIVISIRQYKYRAAANTEAEAANPAKLIMHQLR